MDFSQPREYYVGMEAWRARNDQVTMRIDHEVLVWFKQHNEKYQTAINQALRDHVDRERKVS